MNDVIVKVANYLIVNVYMPCHGTVDRITMYMIYLRDIWAWCEQHDNCRMFLLVILMSILIMVVMPVALILMTFYVGIL